MNSNVREENKTQVMLLLNNMLSSHDEIVRKATEELRTNCLDPESTVLLCKVLNSKHPIPLRQCAANILTMRLSVSANWVSLPTDKHAAIQKELFAALKSLVSEDNEKLQRAIVRNVGLAMSLEKSGDTPGEWTAAVFDYLEAICLSTDLEAQQLGAIVYSLLADAAPMVFIQYMDRGQRIFVRSLQMAEEQGILVTPITDRLLAGMTRALPLGHKYLTNTKEFAAILPLITRTAKTFAYLPHPEKCNRGFDLLINLFDYTPDLLFLQLQPVLEQLLNMAGDRELSDVMRVKSIIFIRRVILVKRRELVKIKMMDRLIWVLYGLLAVEPECDVLDGEEDYLGDERQTTTPFTKGVETLRNLVELSSTDKIAARVLRLVRPHLEQQPTPVQRVGVHLLLAILAEKFTQQLQVKHLRRFISICQSGISDADLMVRRAAFFFMANMVDNLMPEITQMADKIIPMFMDFLEHIPDSQRMAVTESKTNARMFYALENYIEGLHPESIKPHLIKLMPLLLQCAQPVRNSPSLRQMTLSAIASLGETVKSSLEKYFDDIVIISKPLLIQTTQEDMLLLRTQAVHVFGSLSKVNQLKFTMLAPWLLEFVMCMIRDGTDVHFYTFNLLAIISGIIPANFNNHFPMILDSILTTIDSFPSKSEFECSDIMIEGYNKGHGDQTDSEADAHNDNPMEEEGSDSSDSKSSEDDYDYADEREEAIRCLKSFVNHLPDLMLPHMDGIERRLLKCCGQGLKDCVRRAACEALSAFVLLHWRLGRQNEAKKLCSKAFPKMTRFINETDDADNALVALICLGGLLKTMKSEAFVKTCHADKMFSILRNGLRRKLNCQTEDGSSSGEEDEDTLRQRRLQEEYSDVAFKEYLLMQELASLLPIFGYSMHPDQFASYFLIFSSRYMRRLRRYRPGDGINEHRSFIYCVLTRCLAPLGAHAEDYYEDLCRCVVQCINNYNQRVRHHAITSLDELLDLQGSENETQILIKTTSGALVKALQKSSRLIIVEKERICSSLCRMILSDHKICPLDIMLPALFSNLPLCKYVEGYVNLCQALKLLLREQEHVLEEYKSKIVMTLFESLGKDQLGPEAMRQEAIAVIKHICKDNPELFDEAVKQFPEAGLLVQ